MLIIFAFEEYGLLSCDIVYRMLPSCFCCFLAWLTLLP
jgi:hypothetical protein